MDDKRKSQGVVTRSKLKNSEVPERNRWQHSSLRSIYRVDGSTVKCHLCKLTVGSKDCFYSHVDVVKNAGQVVYKCKICQYQRKVRSEVKRHVRSHTREKRFKCLLCPYKASIFGSIKGHMQSQHGSMYTQSNTCTDLL